MAKKAKFKELIAPMTDIFNKYGVKFRTSDSSSQLIMDTCFNCGRSKKLYVSKEKGTWLCFRCGEKGGPVDLMKNYCQLDFKEAMKELYGENKFKINLDSLDDEDDEIENKKIEQKKETPEDFKLNLKGMLKKNITTGSLKLPDPIELDSSLVPLTEDFEDAYNYLIGRGYTSQIIKDLKILVYSFKTKEECFNYFKDKFKEDKDSVWKAIQLWGRVLFPLYIDGEVMGYVARDFTGKAEKKVLNSTGNFRSHSVWNYDLTRTNEELVVCEGTTSAVKCGIYRSIALLGKMASPGQLRLIRQMKAKKLYLCLDIGTEKEQADFYKNMAIYYPGKIYFIETPPVIPLKGRIIESEIVNEIKETFGIELSILETEGLAHFPYEGKKKIFKEVKILDKLPTDQKKTILHNFLIKNDKSHLESTIFWLLFDSEYKDAGDYSEEEMEVFKQKSKLISGDTTIE